MDAKFIANCRDLLKSTEVKKFTTTSNYQFYDESEGGILLFDQENEIMTSVRTSNSNLSKGKKSDYEITCVHYGDIFLATGYTDKKGVEEFIQLMIDKGIAKEEDREKMYKNLLMD